MAADQATNEAVENVTTGISSEKAIDAPWQGNAVYFDEIASRVFGDPARGLVAVAWYGTADGPELRVSLET